MTRWRTVTSTCPAPVTGPSSGSAAVVGYDGTAAARAAVELAAQEAWTRRCHLAIVAVSAGRSPVAEAHLADLVRGMQDFGNGLSVTGHVLSGRPDAVLRRLSADACLVVIGRPEPRTAASQPWALPLSLGALAACPVLVAGPARGSGVSRRLVVVALPHGVSGATVLDVAATAAVQRGAELRCVAADGVAADGVSGTSAAAADLVRRSIDQLGSARPPASAVVCHAEQLQRVALAEARDAELLVVPAPAGPGDGPLRATLLATVGCPVMLVPPRLRHRRTARAGSGAHAPATRGLARR